MRSLPKFRITRDTLQRCVQVGEKKLVKESMPPDLILGPQPECSYARKSHYSFDFAHQVLFPSDPLQPGPIYFKCTRKCRLFSVACEAFPEQVNFMLSESIITLLYKMCDNSSRKEKQLMPYLV